jgi:hypothetical protein
MMRILVKACGLRSRVGRTKQSSYTGVVKVVPQTVFPWWNHRDVFCVSSDVFSVMLFPSLCSLRHL